MNVMITNDDGIDSPSLKALYRALHIAGHEVCAIAPMTQQSGVGRAVTVFGPILTRSIIEYDFKGTGVFGTPVDCVKLGIGHILPFKPDLVISGINQGPNAGPDIYYSGTVGAAAEAAQHKVPAMAVSHMDFKGPKDLEEIATHVIKLAEQIPWNELPEGRVINVNYPGCLLAEAQEIRLCGRSGAIWPNQYSKRSDPRGEPYWWFASELDPAQFEAESDRALLLKGHITITPLQFETTDKCSFSSLAKIFSGKNSA